MNNMISVFDSILGTYPTLKIATLNFLDSFRYVVHSVEICSDKEYSDHEKRTKDAEKELRERAYRAFIHTESYGMNEDDIKKWLESICNNKDINCSKYWIAVVYKRVYKAHKETSKRYKFLQLKPILSCRYYCDENQILKELYSAETQKWCPQSGITQKLIKTDLISQNIVNSVVLIDRLADFTRKDWPITMTAHALVFNKVIHDTNAKVCFGIARQTADEVFLRKYFAFGMELIGITKYKIGEFGEAFNFWILRGNRSEMNKFIKALSPTSRQAFKGINMSND